MLIYHITTLQKANKQSAMIPLSTHADAFSCFSSKFKKVQPFYEACSSDIILSLFTSVNYNRLIATTSMTGHWWTPCPKNKER